MIIGMKRHSDEDLLQAMRDVAARHSGHCSLTTFDRDRLNGLVEIWPQTISHRFGSWDDALIKAGLPLNHRLDSNR
jgi:hypothetical protein